mgnify:CR=1 FL=1
MESRIVKAKVEIEDPLVSIIVITYNSENYIIDTLESFKSQTYNNLEIIISDDCSTDNTLDVCNKWLENNRNRFNGAEIVTSSLNTGISPNLNRGIKIARGEWIKPFGGDDALYPDLIQKYIDFVKKSDSEVEFLHSKAINYLENFNKESQMATKDVLSRKINKEDITAKEQFEILLRTDRIASLTVMIKKSVFNKVGYFDERYPMFDDTPMWLKITKHGIKLHYLDIMGAKYRVRKNSVIRSNTNQKFLNDFGVARNKALKEIFLPHLPFHERLLKSTSFRLNNFFRTLDNDSTFVKTAYNVTTLPLMYLINKINRSYR